VIKLIPSFSSAIEDSLLDSDFSFVELNEAIGRLATNKAPGPDSITNEVWKALDYNNRICLLDSINELWRNNRVPDSLSEIVISPIHKKGDRCIAANYRPISLVNTSLKLITMLMTERLNIWCEKKS
jgi:hypothetical protein